MVITLMNVYGGRTEHNVGKLRLIKNMTIRVWSGNEELEVTYKDGTVATFDSDRHHNMFSVFEGSYELYDIDNPRNSLLDTDKFKNRKKTYSIIEDEWRKRFRA